MLTHPTLDKLQTLKLSGMYHASSSSSRWRTSRRSALRNASGSSSTASSRSATPSADHALAAGQTASAGLHRRYRLSASPGLGQGPDDPSRHVPVGAGASQRLDHWPDGHWKNLARLCVGPQGLPGRLDRALPPAPRFLQELPIAKGDGRYGKLMTTLAKTDLLILDDWGLAPLSDENRRDLLEIVEDRHDCRATLVTSQLPVEHWHEALGDPTLADAILDRLVHNAYKITLQGESMRKRQARLTRGATAE